MKLQHFAQQYRQLALLARRENAGHAAYVLLCQWQRMVIDHASACRRGCERPGPGVCGRFLFLQPSFGERPFDQVAAGVVVQAHEARYVGLGPTRILHDCDHQSHLARRCGFAVNAGKLGFSFKVGAPQKMRKMPRQIKPFQQTRFFCLFAVGCAGGW